MVGIICWEFVFVRNWVKYFKLFFIENIFLLGDILKFGEIRLVKVVRFIKMELGKLYCLILKLFFI